MKKQKMRGVLPTIAVIVMILFCISFIVPILWALMTSFKSNLEFIRYPFQMPKKWHWENYTLVFEKLYIRLDTGYSLRNVYLPELFFNSFAWSFISAIVSVSSGCMVAYVLAKYKFKLGSILYGIIIAQMIIPTIGTLGSSLNIMRTTGVYDNFFGLTVITKISLSGAGFLYFYAAFKSISWTYAEAAFMDGAGHFRVMVTIMIPLVMPTFFAMFLLNFVTHWNEWNATLIYIPSLPTAAYALYKFQNNVGNKTSGVPFVMIACMFLTVPIIILFIAFSDKMIGSITMGGLKG